MAAHPGANASPPKGPSASSVVTFRAEATRAGASKRVAKLVDERSWLSPGFAAIGRDHEVRTYGEGTKQGWHPTSGTIALEYSPFAVDGQPDLGMVVFSPTTPADADRIRALLESYKRLPLS